MRILPAYWLVALVALVWFGRDTLTAPLSALRTFLLLHIYGSDPIPAGLPQTWSLATEVSFYAVLPLLAVALHPLLRRGRTAVVLGVLGGVEAVTLLSVVLTHVPSAGPYPPAQLWLPEYAGYFAAGMALAVVAARTAEPPALARRPWLCWGVALGAYVLVSTPLTGSTLRYPTVGQALLEHALYLVVAVGLVVPLALGPARPERATPARLLSRPLPAWLGQISYGLFLWHMVVVEAWLRTTGERAGSADFLVLFPVTVVLSVGCAALSHYLVERPLRRLRGRTPVPRGRPSPRPAAT